MSKNFNKLIPIFLVLFFSSILIIDPLLKKGIFTAHDIETNITYFGAFYNSLTEGNIFPRWSGNIANLYGSPTSMFFYPFSYYLSAPIRLLGFSLIDTTKIYLFLTFIGSSLFMYLWLKRHVNTLSAVLGAILYVYAPYRINDIYARGSVAENTAFVFVPLVVYAIDLLWEKLSIKRMIFLALILAAFILSHPFMLIVFAPFYLLYLLFLKPNLRKIIYLTASSVFSLLVTAFYTIPLVFENKYTHYDISPFNGKGYAEQFLTIEKLIMPVWNFIDIKGKLEYQTYQIGLLQIGLFLISIISLIFLWRRKGQRQKVMFLPILGIINFFLSIFLMLPMSDFVYKIFSFLQRIEFPWRYLALNLFAVAVFTGGIFNLLHQTMTKIAILAVMLLGFYLYLPYSKGHDYKTISDDYYLYNIKENTDGFATLPKWAAQPDSYDRKPDRYKVISGEAKLTPLFRTSTKHIFIVEATTTSRIADLTFYFPGWNVFLDKKPVDIEFQDPNYRGIITFNVEEGRHLLEVVFTNTKVRQLADTISLSSIIFICIAYIYADKIQKRLHRYSGL
ncbi:MAG: 6-pyruvoyl-tetrahydropterin synthase-related protein [Candidatus Omnitrophica bacterium]|nr:6-pyruvoyl-tetrahydropterin synthase-related protein [Candidatus Omnitrophota bacterium]